eukprot:sb/3473868/
MTIKQEKRVFKRKNNKEAVWRETERKVETKECQWITLPKQNIFPSSSGTFQTLHFTPITTIAHNNFDVSPHPFSLIAIFNFDKLEISNRLHRRRLKNVYGKDSCSETWREILTEYRKRVELEERTALPIKYLYYKLEMNVVEVVR